MSHYEFEERNNFLLARQGDFLLWQLGSSWRNTWWWRKSLTLWIRSIRSSSRWELHSATYRKSLSHQSVDKLFYEIRENIAIDWHKHCEKANAPIRISFGFFRFAFLSWFMGVSTFITVWVVVCWVIWRLCFWAGVFAIWMIMRITMRFIIYLSRTNYLKKLIEDNDGIVLQLLWFLLRNGDMDSRVIQTT